MSRLFALLAACLTLVSLAARGDAEPQPAVTSPVIDLRVGLQENVTRRGRNLWEGTHQAGISQLRQGRVAGVLATYSASSAETSSAELAIGFAQFKSALLSSQAFELKAIARTGGVVALSLDRSLIGDGVNTSLDDVVRQLEHLVRVAGPEHVAVASGFATGSVPPSSLGNATRFPRLAQALTARGMSGSAVRGVLYDNAFRVLCKRV